MDDSQSHWLCLVGGSPSTRKILKIKGDIENERITKSKSRGIKRNFRVT